MTRHDETLSAEERRAHGVHYTPEEMAAEVVTHTIERIFVEHQPTSTFLRSLRFGDMAMGDGVFIIELCRYLGDQLAAAWDREGYKAGHPRLAYWIAAEDCIFGVELDPVAAAKARANLAAFVDCGDDGDTYEGSLVCGDALVGLSPQQIGALDWSVEADTPSLLGSTPLSGMGFAELGDAVLGAFFSADKDKARRKELLARRPTMMAAASGAAEAEEQVQRWSAELRAVVQPLHWYETFPWLISRWSGAPSRITGFVGNPPFVGGGKISQVHGTRYLDWLHHAYPMSSGRMDLCAFFFRRAWELMTRGAMGMIATNTISQGDTRRGGLKAIVDDGGRIFRVHRNEEWPGDASVQVSTVFVSKQGLAPDEQCWISERGRER